LGGREFSLKKNCTLPSSGNIREQLLKISQCNSIKIIRTKFLKITGSIYTFYPPKFHKNTKIKTRLLQRFYTTATPGR